MSLWDDIPPAIQISIGASAGFTFAVGVLYVGIRRFIRGASHGERKDEVTLTDYDVADMGPVRALTPALQRMFTVQTDINEGVQELVAILRKQVHDAEVKREVDRAVKEDRDRRGLPPA